MNEVWKIIQDYPNYEVSNMGRVRSVDRVSFRNGKESALKGKMLKPSITNGYYRVVIYGGSRNIKRQVFVHRLVAENFLDNPNNLPFINHKDENKLNNNVNNLEFCTAKYNSNYGTSIERRVKNQNWDSIADKQSKPVIQMTPDGLVVNWFKSTMEAQRKGYNSSAISKCCNGHLKTYKGFIWRYENQGDLINE